MSGSCGGKMDKLMQKRRKIFRSFRSVCAIRNIYKKNVKAIKMNHQNIKTIRKPCLHPRKLNTCSFKYFPEG